jgi:two-component system chemotaxis sensor kinase CheA
MDDLIQEFVTETTESLGHLDRDMVAFERTPDDADTLSRIFRLMHTVKGTCGFLGLSRLERVAHAGEDVLGKFRDKTLDVTPGAVSAILRCIDVIRGIVEALQASGSEPEGDDTILIGELRAIADGKAPVVASALVPAETAATPIIASQGFPVAAELMEEVAAVTVPVPVEAPVVAAPIAVQSVAKKETIPQSESPKDAQTIRVGVDVLENLMTLVSEMVLTRNQLLQINRTQDDSPYKAPVQRLNRITSELQESVMKTRMQPIGNAWNKLPRIVRDLAAELGKKIDLQMIGAETELDRQVLEMIRDPLTHMVRNSADHGLENPADRTATGKGATGTIRLSARHEGGHIIIEIADDGRGLNTARIRAKIVEKGLATDAELAAMDENQIHQFIMKAGFSTAEKVTNVSGRGVGMDVVRSNIEKIGGTLEFRSVQGKGSTFTVKIPLTLAIVNALIVETTGQRYAIPQIAVREVVRTGKDGPALEQISGAPVIRLRNRLLPVLSLAGTLDLKDPSADRSVVVCHSGSLTFGVAVERITDAEEIVVKPLSDLAKAAGIYSGNTILGDGTVVLILDTNALGTRLGAEARETGDAEDERAVASNTQDVLIFKGSALGNMAVTLSDVSRIESLDMTSVEWIQGNPVIQYRGELLTLTAVDGTTGIHDSGRQHVLVLSKGAAQIGLAIEKLEDIVAAEVKFERASRRPGVLGSQIVAGRSVDFLDPAYFLAQADQAANVVQFGEAA